MHYSLTYSPDSTACRRRVPARSLPLGPALRRARRLPVSARRRARSAGPHGSGSCAPRPSPCHNVTGVAALALRLAVCTCAGSCQGDVGMVQRGLRVGGFSGGPPGRLNLHRSPAMTAQSMMHNSQSCEMGTWLVSGTLCHWRARCGLRGATRKVRSSGSRRPCRAPRRGPAATATRSDRG